MSRSSAQKGTGLILAALLLVLSTGCSSQREVKPLPNPVGPTLAVTDSLGREVQVPEGVTRIACLYSFSCHVVAMLGKGDSIVALGQGQKRDILLNEMVPELKNALVPHANDKINAEELARSQPDLIFLQLETYQDEREREKIEKMKVPYLVVNFNSIDSQVHIIESIGKAIGRWEEAKKYTAYYYDSLERVAKVVATIPPDQRVRIYHSINEATRTDGPNTLPADWTKVAGTVNVSVGEQLRVSDNKYIASLEQIYLWDPDAILVNEDTAYTYITSNAQWASLRAVKNRKVYKMPNGISRWGHHGSLETPLAILWTAKTLYPDHFRDLNMPQETKRFYETFFNYPLSEDAVARVLAGMGMRAPEGK